MSGKIARPIARLEYYSGPKNRHLIAFNKANDDFKSGQITRKQFTEQIKEINKKQTKYMDGLAKALEKRVFMKQQAQAFQREFEKEQKRLEKERMDRESEARLRAQVEAVRLEREAREKAMKEKREARKAQKEDAKFLKNIVYDETHTFKTFNEDKLYSTMKQLQGATNAYIMISRNGDIVIDELINVPTKSYNIYYQTIYHTLFGYDASVFDGNAKVRIVIARASEIPSLRLKQKFRDGGDKHCVLDPMIQMYKSYAENAKSDDYKRRVHFIIKKLIKLRSIYIDGVPEDKMDEVGKVAYRRIDIYDVLGNCKYSFNKSSSKAFNFTNTRENHLDAGHITMDKQYQQVTQEELNQILYYHDKEEIFYLFRGDLQKNIPQSLRSSKGAWAVFNEDYEVFQKFNEMVGVKNYRLNATKYPIVNDFVNDGRIVHSAPIALCNKPNDLKNAFHYDMVKAYTQHSTAHYFSGFLGHIQQWSKLTGKGLDFVRNHLGMFRFRVIRSIPLLRKLGMIENNEYTLAGPELLYMCDVLGLDVELIAGCWGSRAEINYTPEMLEKRRYCTWAGKLGMESKCDRYIFRGSSEWASHLKSEFGEDRVSFWGNFICVNNPKGRVNTTHHLFAFITAYSRIHMLEMMRRVNGELIKVVLDGLYFRGSMNTEGLSTVIDTNKKLITHKGFGVAWYLASIADITSWEEYSSDLDGSCVLAGAGGTGKSWRVFNDKTICQPLYVVPSHLLGRKFREQYDASYTTIHKLIGEDCRPYGEENGTPANIFIDELTMIEGSWVEKAIKMYPQSRFYIAGDIDGDRWYQCRNGSGQEFSTIWIPSRTEWRYLDFTKDMRSRDDKLRNFKEDVRALMREVFTDGGRTDAYRINQTIRQKLPTVKFDDAVKMFQSGDIWIAGTHNTNKKLLDAGVVSGFINARKEINDTEGEKRGAFTCHSFQGLTISDKRVFVSLDMFEYAMFYTAISRVCYFDQLVIVN